MNKISFFICTLITSILSEELKFHEYHLDLFKEEPVPTEYNSYKLLKKNPIKKNINYLAIPWTPIINKKLYAKIPEIKLNGGFTICQHIDYEQIIPILKKIGIDVLFTPHVDKEYNGIKVLPFPHVAANGVAPSLHKDIYYSFIGFKNTHWTRTEIFKMKHPKNTVLIERKEWHFWINKKQQESLKHRQEKEKLEYQDILSRSIFSLCPRGTGASTIRFWESLEAGSIPVLISDDMKLPQEFNWNNCVVKIHEKDVHKIPEILSKISIQKQTEMINNCLKAYKLFSGNNFVKTIRNYYK